MKKLLLLIFGLFFINQSISAQDNKRINELLERFKSTEIDTLRVEILDHLWDATTYSTPKAAIKYAEDAIALSKEINYSKGYVRGFQRLGIAYSNISEYKKSNEAYDTALKIYEKNRNHKLAGIILHNKAINFKDQSQYDSTMYYNDLAALKYKEANDTIRFADIHGLRASVYYEKGQFLLALQNSLKEAAIYKSTDTLRYADAMRTIASIQAIRGVPEQAKASFHECIDIYKKNDDNYFLAIAYRELGEVFRKSKPVQNDSATYYFKKSIKLAQDIETPGLEASSLMFYGDMQLELKKYKEAKNTLTNGLNIAQNIDSHLNISNALLGLSEISLVTHNYNEALNYANEALKLSQEKNLNEDISEAYKRLYKIYKAKQDSKNTLFYFEKYKQKSDSIYNIEKTNRINELQTIYETKKKETEIALQEQEIEALNTQAKNNKLTKTLYGIGMFSFLTIAGLLYFGFKQRMKKNRIEREKQEAIYKQEIEFKKKELASQTLHLVQKNTFINELKDNLERIKQSPELFKIEFRRLVMLLKKESAEDKDWEVFKSYFSEVHNDFDLKLKNISNDISEKEIRLASFVRMNLSTKEIASILNVLPESVIKSKYRLKKKLQLDKDTDINTFLNDF